MVLFTIIVPNNQLITRIKTNLTLTELDANDVVLLPHVQPALPVTFIEDPDFLQLGLPEYKEHFQSNPTLNSLYLGHSPPLLT